MKSMRALTALIALGFVALFVARQALAVPMSVLFQGESITVLDKKFSNFTLVDVNSVNGGLTDIGSFEVTPLADDPLNPGIKFTATTGAIGTPFGHDGFSSATVIFEFDVQTTNNLPLIKDNSLLINDFVFDSNPNAFIQITELVLDASGNALGDKRAIARVGDTPGSGDPDHFDSLEFAPQAFLHVRKTIDVVGPDTNDGARLRMFEQRFSQVPEPATWVVACLMWLGLGVCRPSRPR